MTNRTLAAGLFAVSTLASGGAFAATELITNGGFEDSMNDWTCNFGVCQSVSSGVFGNPVSGTNFGRTYSNFFVGELTQTIATTAGETYDFSFWSFASNNAANTLSYSLDGGSLVSVALTTDFAQSIDSFVASGSSAVISLFFETNVGSGSWRFDDVSVTQSSISTPAVPLPAGLPLALSGLAALGLLRRKSRDTTTA